MKILFLLIVLSFNAFAQMQGLVKYRKVLNLEADAKSGYIETQGQATFLFFTSEKSVFITNNTLLDSLPAGPPPRFCTNVQDRIGQVYLKKYAENTLKVREFISNQIFLVDEPTPTQKWILLNETKKIGNFSCQKATCTFRGRDYVAWYTLQIPIKTGPWKFGGCPGLILEICSVDEEVKFLFEEAKIPHIAAANFWQIPTKDRILTWESYKQVGTKIRKFYKDSAIQNALSENRKYVEVEHWLPHDFIERNYE